MNISGNLLLDHPELLFVLLFLLTLAVLESGYRAAARTGVNLDDARHAQIVSLRDALGILLSLLLGFTFAMAVSRFDKRQELVIQEANAIGTAHLRAAFAGEPRTSLIRTLLQTYVKTRLEFFDAGLDQTRLRANASGAKDLQNRLWEQVLAVPAQEHTAAYALLAQSINEVIDLDAERLGALENRIPSIIWILITFMAVLTCVATGYSMKARVWFPILVLPLMISAVAALLADLDTPRSGFIRARQHAVERLSEDFQK